MIYTFVVNDGDFLPGKKLTTVQTVLESRMKMPVEPGGEITVGVQNPPKDPECYEVLCLYARIANREHGEKNGCVPKDIEDYVQTRIARELKKHRKGGKRNAATRR